MQPRNAVEDENQHRTDVFVLGTVNAILLYLFKNGVAKMGGELCHGRCRKKFGTELVFAQQGVYFLDEGARAAQQTLCSVELADDLGNSLLLQLVNQVIDRLIVGIKGSLVDLGPFGNFPHGDFFQRLFLDKLVKRAADGTFRFLNA